MDGSQPGGSVPTPEPGARVSFQIVRNTPGPHQDTEGTLSFGDQTLFTLEKPWNSNQRGISCIPEGEYPCIIAPSEHFQRLMPHLLNVPDRDGILIHPANYVSQLEGCIAVGRACVNGVLLNSQVAFEQFWTWFEPQAKQGPVACQISSVRNWSA